MAEARKNRTGGIGKKLLRSRALRWGVGIVVSLAFILFVAGFFIDEPLRRLTEQKMNQALKGYSVRLPDLHFSLIGLSVTLKGLAISQQAHPAPPVARFPYLKASVHWREILSGRLVAEFRLDDPKIHVNLKQLRTEAKSKVPMKDKGWQQAAEAIYPLKINLLKINNGNITYIDQDPARPLRLTRLNLRAGNIRNVRLPDNAYPSDFHLETDIFKTGRGTVDGKANFLAEPTPAVKADVKLEKVPLEYFKPVLSRYNASIDGGVLHADGHIEHGPKVQAVRLKRVEINGVRLDYIHAERTAVLEKKRAEKVKEKAQEVSNRPDLVLSIERFVLTGSNLGMVNDVSGRKYRVFISGADFSLSNFSNQFAKGPAKAKLAGQFMGSGSVTASATFRPATQGADFDMYMKVNETNLVSLNDLLRAYGNFDVSAGSFSLVTELHVAKGRVEGYVKPFFKDMKVYDRRKDKDEGFFHQAYEMVVGGIAKILENKPRDQVATRAGISGSLENPRANTWEVIVQLVRNAFFRAILPTFETEVKALGD